MRTYVFPVVLLLLGCWPVAPITDGTENDQSKSTRPIKTAQCAPHTMPNDYAEARRILSVNARLCSATETSAYRITEAMCEEIAGMPAIELRVQYTAMRSNTTEVFVYINNALSLAYARIDDALCTGRLGQPLPCVRYVPGSTRMWCINHL